MSTEVFWSRLRKMKGNPYLSELNDNVTLVVFRRMLQHPAAYCFSVLALWGSDVPCFNVPFLCHEDTAFAYIGG